MSKPLRPHEPQSSRILCGLLHRYFSMRFFLVRILEWVPFPSPGDLPRPGIKLLSPALAGWFFTTEPLGKPICQLHLNKTGGKYLLKSFEFFRLTYLFLAALGLPCFSWAFSSCSEQGPLSIAGHRLSLWWLLLQCTGFSMRWLPLLPSAGSRHSGCSSWASRVWAP